MIKKFLLFFLTFSQLTYAMDEEVAAAAATAAVVNESSMLVRTASVEKLIQRLQALNIIGDQSEQPDSIPLPKSKKDKKKGSSKLRYMQFSDQLTDQEVATIIKHPDLKNWIRPEEQTKLEQLIDASPRFSQAAKAASADPSPRTLSPKSGSPRSGGLFRRRATHSADPSPRSGSNSPKGTNSLLTLLRFRKSNNHSPSHLDDADHREP